MESSLQKCVVLGDGAVGKTCLLMVYAKDQFPDTYDPTVFDNYQVKVTVGEDTYTIALFDTAGQEDFDRFRPMVFPGTDIFIVCYSIANPASYYNISTRWFPEIKKYSSTTPILIVGTQVDLRNDEATLLKLAKRKEKPISNTLGKNLATELGAAYCECSALTRTGIREAFTEAIAIALGSDEHLSTKKTLCSKICSLF
ncbi:cell division control protein 42 homolog isoform X2 [Eurytemora carolleeae]|uniref:cell division control protein 42 homolog isoform X2 n=1 Tax=Eurytemora carolleeae TaxID=1294199 RepID=UPI000C784BCE|nr:cell division control protein 42 homolog isoform X2 [Eurytemora carolleeae]|eukprot:XP_023322353.1 cell division control protein 42 homolog isoform X2 [Eurytemora affinis]